MKIIQLQNSLRAEIQIEFSWHLPWDLDLQASWAPVWQGMQKPRQPGVGSMCRQRGKPGWLLSVQTDMFGRSFSCTEFIFFQWKEKVSLGDFQPVPYPTTLIARPTGRDGWHLPLLFCSHVNLPWCGGRFFYKYRCSKPAVLPYTDIFSSKCCPAGSERMIAIVLPSSHLLSLLTPFLFLFSPLVLYSCREKVSSVVLAKAVALCQAVRLTH